MKFLKPPKNMFLRKKDVYFKYSTEEQWIGEYWIDGKKIYQKVIVYSIANQHDFYVPLNISNLRQIIEVKIVGGKENENIFYPIPMLATTGNFGYNWAIVSGNLRMFISMNIDTNLNIIVKYTKTTD